MNQSVPVHETPGVLPEPKSALAELEAAQSLLYRHRARGLAAFNRLFRAGTIPGASLQGRHAGAMNVIDIAPGFTPFFQWLADLWMPWKGKTFDFARERGENIFTNDSYLLARLFNPLYRGFKPDTAKTYRAFAFRTYLAPGVMDPDRMVLKIDYNLKENPALTVRRVLDELVQLEDGLYLGKAHVHWWGSPAGTWQTVAYFSLAQPAMFSHYNKS